MNCVQHTKKYLVVIKLKKSIIPIIVFYDTNVCFRHFQYLPTFSKEKSETYFPQGIPFCDYQQAL